MNGVARQLCYLPVTIYGHQIIAVFDAQHLDTGVCIGVRGGAVGLRQGVLFQIKSDCVRGSSLF